MDMELYRLSLLRILETIDPSLRTEFLQNNLRSTTTVIAEFQERQRIIVELLAHAIANAEPATQHTPLAE